MSATVQTLRPVPPEFTGDDSLLGYPEDLEYRTRHLPKLALRAMRGALYALDQERAKNHARGDAGGTHVEMDADALAGFMELIEVQLDCNLPLATVVQQARAEKNTAPPAPTS